MTPGSERSPGEGNGNLRQYSCQKNPMTRGALRTRSHGVTESGMTEHLDIHRDMTWISLHVIKVSVRRTHVFIFLRLKLTLRIEKASRFSGSPERGGLPSPKSPKVRV